MSDKEQQWQVEKILQRGKFNNVIHYLVLWKGYQISEATWEPISNLKNCEEAIVQFQSIFNTQKKVKINNKSKKRLKVQNIFRKQSNKFVNCLKVEEDIKETETQQNQIIKEIMNEKQREMITDEIIQEKANMFTQFNETQQKNDTLEKQLRTTQNQINQMQSIFDKSFKRNRQEDDDKGQDNEIEEKIQKRIKVNQSQENQLIIANQQKKLNICVKQQNIESNMLKTSQNQQKLDELNPKIIFSQFSQPQCNKMRYNQEIINNKQDLLKQLTIIEKEKEQKDKIELFVINQNNIQKTNVNHANQKDQFEPQQDNSPQKEIVHTKRNQILSLRPQNLERYRFLDSLYEQNQKIYIINITRKIQGKKSLKIKANMIDLTKNPQILSNLAHLRYIDQETTLEKIQFLIKQDYGWLTVGKNSSLGHVIMDVNLIEEKYWKIFLEMMMKKRQEI